MSGSESSKIKQSIIKIIKDDLKNNLFAIISVGSFASGNYKEAWSDIDILVVVEKLDLQAKEKIARSIKKLEKIHKRHFGVNTITKQEFQDPALPTISLDGKTLQGLLDLKSLPGRMIFPKHRKINKIYYPSKKEVKDYSISNLFMFLLRNRKTLTARIPRTLREYKDMTAKEMRAGFIITKLAIQYFTLGNCRSNEETIRAAEKLFKDFNFNALKTNLRLINKWSQIKERHQLDEILKSSDAFMENFSRYISKKLVN